MPALVAGKPAPEFTLPLAGGKSFSLREALSRGPVLLAFFKVSCPVCQFTFPYLERVFQAYGKSGKATILGVSQDDAKATQDFCKQFGVTLPVALDDASSYPVSNQYGLTNVPTLFLVAPSGSIEVSSVGWSRAEVEEIAGELARAAAAKPVPIITAKDSAPDFKAG